VVRGWLGVGIQPMTPELAAGLGAPGTTGALVTQVIPGGPAERAGLHQGDIVVSYNGKAIVTGTDLTRQVGETAPGTKVTLKVVREGASKSFTVKIDELHDGSAARPEDQPDAEDQEAPPQNDQQDPLGLAVRPVHPQLAQSMGLRPGEGVQVVAVNPDGPASEVGVQPGDVILEVNRAAVHSLQDYRKELKATKPGQMALLRLQRRQDLFYVTVKLK
jgi:serine protease Do